MCAQIDNGNIDRSITGRVTTPKGAAIAGAQVTVTQCCAYTVVTRVYTWLHRRSATNRTGLFSGG